MFFVLYLYMHSREMRNCISRKFIRRMHYSHVLSNSALLFYDMFISFQVKKSMYYFNTRYFWFRLYDCRTIISIIVFFLLYRSLHFHMICLLSVLIVVFILYDAFSSLINGTYNRNSLCNLIKIDVCFFTSENEFLSILIYCVHN